MKRNYVIYFKHVYVLRPIMSMMMKHAGMSHTHTAQEWVGQLDNTALHTQSHTNQRDWLFSTRHIMPKTYNIPLHDVHTNDPTVMLTYVGPLWWQSKHVLLCSLFTISRKRVRCFSSCFRLDAIFDWFGGSVFSGSTRKRHKNIAFLFQMYVSVIYC